MATFRYRGATAAGAVRSGVIEAANVDDVIGHIRRLGLLPIEAVATSTAAKPTASGRVDGQTRQAVANMIGELSVLLGAGLALDRALAVCVGNVGHARVKSALERIHAQVKTGAPLSQAIGGERALFPPMASAMCEAGEADGRLSAALSRLAESLDRAQALRDTVVSSLVYPAVLLVVASGVILLMLLVVVPQFENLFEGAEARLPLATRVIMGASRFVRAYGVLMLLGLVAAGFAIRQWLGRPAARLAFDRGILKAPWVGPIVVDAETAAFARTLGSLVDGGVPLPSALAIARRSLTNTHIADVVGKVTAGLKEGGGLSGPLAASKVFPPMAISFLKTGEETAQLGLMLGRLSEVLDRGVRTRLQRLVGILTPAITVGMAAIVATLIASIMSAILGFNDLALQS